MDRSKAEPTTSVDQVSDVLKLVRPDLLTMPGYEPIEPLEVLAERLGMPAEQIAKLDGNENLYGPSPRVYEALANLRSYHIYPDPHQSHLRMAIAGYAGVPAERIVAGSGSDELIDLILRLFVAPGEAIVTCAPTFGVYAFCARVLGARVIDAPRRDDFSLDLDAVKEAVRQGGKVIFLTSPNNPTGNPLSRAELANLLSLNVIVVVDEAYGEFAGSSFIPLVEECDSLIVLRTFSKWAGLAGLRVGYGIFPQPLVPLLMNIKQPYNVNVAAQAAVIASLEDTELLQTRVRAIVQERSNLYAALKSIPFLKPLPSEANFILCKVQGIRARELKERLMNRGILVRYFDSERLRDYIRISVGLPGHTRQLVSALHEIGAEIGLS